MDEIGWHTLLLSCLLSEVSVRVHKTLTVLMLVFLSYTFNLLGNT